MEKNHRTENRNEVALDAFLEVRGALLSGRLLDISHGGAFFRPDASLAHCQLHDHEEACAAALPGLSAKVGFGDEKTLVRGADVRWHGMSVEHDCLGIGVQFREKLWDLLALD